MILILSEPGDQSTNDVIDWLDQLGVRWMRLNGSTLDDGSELSFDPDTNIARINGLQVGSPTDCITAIWLRRWRRMIPEPFAHIVTDVPDGREPIDFCINLAAFRRAEVRALTSLVLHLWDGKPWLGNPARVSLNKLQVLAAARQSGLEVPASLITSSRAAAREFLAKHSAVITKPIAEVTQLPLDHEMYMTYTTRISDSDLALLPDTFFPALFQAEIPKSCELRVFFLAGQCYAMAMFTQARNGTAVDFRRYNFADPTRCVPYTLPSDIWQKICELMEKLEITTGSLDLILSNDDRYVFLEVNPVGQFGMTSEPCNYQIDRRIAEHLQQLGRINES